MNYFKHHIGDYAAATAHLSWDEDMAYTRLIRVYYQHERPIPDDMATACRLARASSPAQKRAVETVLREFFVLGPDGWRQKRCDEELGAAAEKAERNRDIGRKGGRPPKPETQTVSENNPDGFQKLSEKKPSDNPSHKPIANSHGVSAETPSAPVGAKVSVLLPDWIPKDAWDGYVQMRTRIKRPLTDRAKSLAIGELDKLRAAGHDPRAVLDQSTLNSWQGLFEPKPASSTNAAKRPGVHIGQQDFGRGWN